MNDIKTIGICTGGGDCPGLNAVIRGVVKTAVQKYSWRVMGVTDGFDGLIWPERSFELTLDTVSGILPRGGTILGTTNRGNPFEYNVVEDGRAVTRDISDQVIANAGKMGLDALVVVGGDGTQGIGLKLFQKGLKVVGVPKTIDNDLSSTEVTFGFDTAVHTVMEAVDKLFTTGESHHRVMVMEVMGREAGWIALHGGIAGGAHVILLPEMPFSLKKVCDFIQAREKSGKRFTIVVVAEGVSVPDDLTARFAEEKRVPHAGGIANMIGEGIGMYTKKEVRVTVLGHVQRGGSPSSFDRILSTRFGVGAVELIANRQFGRMVCVKEGEVRSVELSKACGQVKLVDPKGQLVRTAKSIGVCFGD